MFCSWVKAEECGFTVTKKQLIKDAVKESIPVEEVKKFIPKNQTLIHRETCEYKMKLLKQLQHPPAMF